MKHIKEVVANESPTTVDLVLGLTLCYLYKSHMLMDSLLTLAQTAYLLSCWFRSRSLVPSQATPLSCHQPICPSWLNHWQRYRFPLHAAYHPTTGHHTSDHPSTWTIHGHVSYHSCTRLRTSCHLARSVYPFHASYCPSTRLHTDANLPKWRCLDPPCGSHSICHHK